MKKRGYSASFAAGLTVASSTMGMIIPPSMAMVLYAIVAQGSVGQLFMAGIIPELMIGIFQLFIVYWRSLRRNYPTEDVPLTKSNITLQFKRSGLVLLMPIVVVGSVVFGIATPTESAGLGVLYGLFVGLFIVGWDSLRSFPRSLRNAIIMSAKIMIVIAFSQLYIWVLALERIPDTLAAYVIGLDLGPTALLMLVAVIILIAGTFIDVSRAILLLTPVHLPAVTAVGVSGEPFEVIMISGLAVGACTHPP